MALQLWAARIFLLCLLSSVSLFAQSSEDRVEALHEQAQSAEAAGDRESAIAKYEEILKLAPRLGPAYNNLGALYFKQGQLSKAATVLERGLKVDPSMHSASALLGITLFEMGDYEKARPHLEAAVKANPADNNAEFTLVNDLTKLGDFEAAEPHLRALAKRQPNNQHIWYLLGRLYMQLGENALTKVNDIDPNSVWAHEISAELMESMKNYDGAIVEWKKAIEAAPQQAGVHFKLGDLYWSLSQWDNATEQFKAEAEIDPKNCRVDWKLGDTLLQRSVEPEQALAYEDKALAACPTLTEAHADRGKALLKLHREQEALPDLLNAEKANPKDASTHFLLAQAYRATGQRERATAEMRTFSELDQKARAATAERAQEVIKNNGSVR